MNEPIVTNCARCGAISGESPCASCVEKLTQAEIDVATFSARPAPPYAGVPTRTFEITVLDEVPRLDFHARGVDAIRAGALFCIGHLVSLGLITADDGDAIALQVGELPPSLPLPWVALDTLGTLGTPDTLDASPAAEPPAVVLAAVPEPRLEKPPSARRASRGAPS